MTDVQQTSPGSPVREEPVLGIILSLIAAAATLAAYATTRLMVEPDPAWLKAHGRQGWALPYFDRYLRDEISGIWTLRLLAALVSAVVVAAVAARVSTARNRLRLAVAATLVCAGRSRSSS